jgi:hypothetical protein
VLLNKMDRPVRPTNNVAISTQTVGTRFKISIEEPKYSDFLGRLQLALLVGSGKKKNKAEICSFISSSLHYAARYC